MKKILVLEDEAAIRSFVVVNLKRAGYEPYEAETGAQALELLEKHSDIDVALLDVMLPDIDGFEVCREIRAGNQNIGIIMLTARTQETDKVTALMTGADDYVTKPFSPAELTARIDALLRRVGITAEKERQLISCPPFLMNLQARTVKKDERILKLTQIEFAILQMFLQNPARALSREDILRAVWGDEAQGDLKTVDVNIRRLRMKIEDNSASPSYITTVWGFGYKWGL